jgi:hypothetical protein
MIADPSWRSGRRRVRECRRCLCGRHLRCMWKVASRQSENRQDGRRKCWRAEGTEVAAGRKRAQAPTALSPAKVQIVGCDGQHLIRAPSGAIIFVAGGTLDCVPARFKDVSWLGWSYRSAKSGQCLKGDFADDLCWTVQHQEIDPLLAKRVSLACFRKRHLSLAHAASDAHPLISCYG